MGFLKDVNKLRKVGNEAAKDYDPAAHMANASAQMAAAQATMQAMTAGATNDAELFTTGTIAMAQVLAVRGGIGRMNFDQIFDVDLLLMAPGMPPRPLTVRRIIPMQHLARVQAGQQVPVRVAADFSSAAFDWARL